MASDGVTEHEVSEHSLSGHSAVEHSVSGHSVSEHSVSDHSATGTPVDTSSLTAGDSATSEAETREVLRWDEVGDVARDLATQIVASGFDAEIVVAIARGGLIVGGALAYALGVKSCGSINVELYTGVDETLPEPLLLPPHLDAASLAGRRVLLADDVSQSGLTLQLANRLITNMGADVRTVCFYTKPQTTFVPDFSWRETDRWIVFPWSAQPPVSGAAHAEA